MALPRPGSRRRYVVLVACVCLSVCNVVRWTRARKRVTLSHGHTTKLREQIGDGLVCDRDIKFLTKIKITGPKQSREGLISPPGELIIYEKRGEVCHA